MWTCEYCGKTFQDSENYCDNCKLHRPIYPKNYCTNPACKWHTNELKNPRQEMCTVCGSLTTFGAEIEKYI